MTTPAGPNLLLLRHGETTWTLSGQHTSSTDLPLTENGEAKAIALRDRLVGRSFGLVLTSPMQRAKRTAELAGLTDPVVDPDLCEWSYGEFEGKTTAEIRQSIPGWTIWDGPWPGGETIDEVAARVDRIVARVRELPVGTTAVAAAHGHVLRVLAARWLGTSPTAGRWFALGTGTISDLSWEHETPVLQHWNS